MSNPNDPYDLDRFVRAQEGVYDIALAEIQDGQKVSHWMWFIFPQIAGLGRSAMSQRFAITSLSEASAYLQHPVLGERLHECTRLVNAIGQPIEQIFGSPDDLKFRSSMTLFAHATDLNHLFTTALQKYFSGEFDLATLERLKAMHQGGPRWHHRLRWREPTNFPRV